jgi:hypothetical protein
LYYVEYFRRKKGVPLGEFHETVRASFRYWEENNPPDRLVLLIGRTWRMGPDPGYMAVWEVNDFQRLRDWEVSAAKKKSAGAPNVADVADMLDSGVYERFSREHQ